MTTYYNKWDNYNIDDELEKVDKDDLVSEERTIRNS